MSLKERFDQYEAAHDTEITKRLPVVIRSELRGFKKLTQNLSQPYSAEMSEIMANAMLYAIVEIQDAVFGFMHLGECNFILRNDLVLDTTPWYQNNIQKMSSTISSLMTVGFYKYLRLCYDDMKLVGDAVFNTKVFAVPYLGEASNYLMWRQLVGMNYAVSEAAAYELESKFEKKTAIKILGGQSAAEKAELLLRHCGINFEEYYPQPFISGVAAYKVPVITGDFTKNKWNLNYNVPKFVDNKDFVSSILNNGKQLYTADLLDGVND
jgi:tRNA(His) 5'-end guanylyltransferase